MSIDDLYNLVMCLGLVLCFGLGSIAAGVIAK